MRGSSMRKLICIVGPTASGKTAQALRVAKKFNGYLLSADSTQVYRQLDIISGKDIPVGSPFLKEKNTFSKKTYTIGFYLLEDTPIYLLDLVPPMYNFSVHDYIKVFQDVILSKKNDHRIPILVGGSGFYVNSVLYGIDTVNVPRDKKLRIGLENATIEDLQGILNKLDKERFKSMNNSDKNNPVRLIRSIEISNWKKNNLVKGYKGLEGYEVIIVGLMASRNTIKERINERVEKRIKEGAFVEAERLFKDCKTLSNSVKTSNGYRQLFEFFAGKIGREEAIDEWKKAEYLNAKKQMTWFGKNKNIHWFDIDQEHFEAKIDEFLTSLIGL